MTTSYTAVARVTVVLDVSVANDESKRGGVDEIRQLVSGLAEAAVTHALKNEALAPGLTEEVKIAEWPRAVTVKLSIDWERDA